MFPVCFSPKSLNIFHRHQNQHGKDPTREQDASFLQPYTQTSQAIHAPHQTSLTVHSPKGNFPLAHFIWKKGKCSGDGQITALLKKSALSKSCSEVADGITGLPLNEKNENFSLLIKEIGSGQQSWLIQLRYFFMLYLSCELQNTGVINCILHMRQRIELWLLNKGVAQKSQRRINIVSKSTK